MWLYNWKDLEVHARSQVQMRNMFLETGERVIFLIRWHITWMDYVLAFCKGRNCDE